mmetsp:Transcript_29332/g.84310  ORF Transcript_29332/g.84310 Transcript_29332/m.84310 type:complete len:269 (+) Transcript_29332:1847-2653(+)
MKVAKTKDAKHIRKSCAACLLRNVLKADSWAGLKKRNVTMLYIRSCTTSLPSAALLSCGSAAASPGSPSTAKGPHRLSRGPARRPTPPRPMLSSSMDCRRPSLMDDLIALLKCLETSILSYPRPPANSVTVISHHCLFHKLLAMSMHQKRKRSDQLSGYVMMELELIKSSCGLPPSGRVGTGTTESTLNSPPPLLKMPPDLRTTRSGFKPTRPSGFTWCTLGGGDGSILRMSSAFAPGSSWDHASPWSLSNPDRWPSCTSCSKSAASG